MANRYFNQFRLSLEKAIVDIFCRVTFGSTGAPTLDTANSKGVVSVTRNSAGTYTFVFGTRAGMLDVYNRLMGIDYVFDTSGAAGAAPAAPAMWLKANSIATVGTSSLQIVFNSAGTATDPASGEAVLIDFMFKNSNTP